MAYTSITASDVAWRALLAQGIERDIENIQNDIATALLDMSHATIGTPYQSELETIVQGTLSSADSDGIQTASVGATIFEESVMVCDDVRLAGSGSAGVGKLELVSSVAELMRLRTTSVVPRYTVVGQTLYARRPSANLPTTSNLLKITGVLKLTDIANLPVSMEHFLIAQLIVMGGGNAVTLMLHIKTS